MADFNKIKQILKNSVDKKLVVVDDDDSYVIITLDEYQHLLESHNFISKISSKTEEANDDSSNMADKEPPTEIANVYEVPVPPPSRAIGLPQANNDDNQDLNEDLNSFSSEENNTPEVRYESLNNEYSEEPI